MRATVVTTTAARAVEISHRATMKDNESTALAIFLTAGSAVLIFYGALYRRGIFSRMWQTRFNGNPHRLGAWVTSALIATAAVIGVAGVLIAHEQSARVLLPFGAFIVSAIGWPIACLHGDDGKSSHPPGEPAAVTLTGLFSVWLCIAASQYGTEAILAPLSTAVMVHHVLVDAIWWPTT